MTGEIKEKLLDADKPPRAHTECMALLLLTLCHLWALRGHNIKNKQTQTKKEQEGKRKFI